VYLTIQSVEHKYFVRRFQCTGGLFLMYCLTRHAVGVYVCSALSLVIQLLYKASLCSFD
jgi:hypothetical protein